jgi:hypothetical protein
MGAAEGLKHDLWCEEQLEALKRQANLEPPAHNQAASSGPRHVKLAGDGGAPDDALAFTGSGHTASVKVADSGVPSRCAVAKHFTEPLPEALRSRGLSEEDWDAIQQKLRVSKGMTAIGPPRGFADTLDKLNAAYFDKLGCIAVQAEFGIRQKGMTVFDRDAWDAKAM